MKYSLSMLVLLAAVWTYAGPAELKSDNQRVDNELTNTDNWSDWAGNNGWKLQRSGHFTMSSDMSTHGIVNDSGFPNVKFYFDFTDDRVLTTRGDGRHAFGLNSGIGSQYWVTGGTFLVPETFWSSGENNQAVIAPQRGNTSTGRNCIFGVYNRVDTSRTKNARVKTPMIRVGWGENNWFVASNNAEVTVGVCEIGAYGSGNGNGILVDSGATMVMTNCLTLKIGSASTSSSNSFIVSNGGVVSGCQRFALGGGEGNKLAFRGVGTDVTFSGSSEKSLMEVVGGRLEVLDGAHFSMEGNQGRVWMGTSRGYFGNEVLVSGNGSQLRCAGNGFLVGQESSSNNSVRVSQGARAEFTSIHVGHAGTQSYPVKNNVLRVEDGGVVVDSAEMDIGGATNAGLGNDWSYGNRLEIVSGGIVSNQSLRVGCFSNSIANAILIDNARMRTSSVVYFNDKGRGSRLTVRNGGVLSAGNHIFVGSNDDGAVWRGADAYVEVLSGGAIRTDREFIFHGTNTTLVVSNALVEAAGCVQLPFNADDRLVRIVLAGTNPVIRSTEPYNKGSYAIGIRREAEIEFVVPQGGYVEAPIQATDGRLGIFNTLTDHPIRFDLSKCDLTSQFTTVLAEAKGAGELLLGGSTAGEENAFLGRIREDIPVDLASGRKMAKVKRVGNKLIMTVGFKGFAITVW